MNRLNKTLITFLLFFSTVFAGTELKQRHYPTEYEIIGLATSNQLNDRGYRTSPRAFIRDANQLLNGQTQIPLLRDHNASTEDVIGNVISLEPTSEGLLFKAKIVDSPDNHELIEKIKRGELVGISVGFVPIKRDGSLMVAGDLLEISVVAIGADPGARILYIGPYQED